MTKKIDDGGPAFPIPGSEFNERYPGMTMRQYYAGLAMQGILASLTPDRISLMAELAKSVNMTLAQAIASQAIDVTDALIAAEKATR
jgi:hypothetical protein